MNPLKRTLLVEDGPRDAGVGVFWALLNEIPARELVNATAGVWRILAPTEMS